MDFITSDSDNQNLVLQTTGTGVDIQDLSLFGDFTLEFRLYLEPNQDITNEDGVVSSGTFGNGSDVNFEEGKLQLYNSSFGGNGVVVQSDTTVEAGKWNHYAVVRQNGQTKIYLNGEVDGTSSQNWTGSFDISHLAQSLSGGLYGQLDELRIWQVARSESEIQDNMDSSVATDSAGLERYYRFDDQPAGHIIDATGNAETGHDLHPPTGASIVNAAEEPFLGEFIDTQVADGLLLPTDLAFLPDGRMIVIEKSGIIKIFEDPTVPGSSSQVYMDLSDTVLDIEERGLIAIEIDPEFETNGYFYLFYTNDVERRTTISRFQHQENNGGIFSRGELASETVLWQEHDRTSSCCHQGGGLAIAHEPIGENDPSPYKIYITVGEEFDGIKSQDLGHDDGKVHRINLTDGSIPIDNPYYEAATASNYTPEIDTSSAISSEGIIQTIYSYGLRNPFRASYDQESNSLFIGEVGGNNNNTSWEDIHIAAPGADHGWPAHEGFFGSSDNPGNPFHSYPHLNGPGQGEVPSFGANGASVTGGVVYRGEDFPEEYRGAYFYGDWVRNWIRYLEIDYSSGEPVLVEDHFFKNATGQVLSFEEAPDGSLYYITTFQTGNVFTFQGAVNRLDWSQNNSAPTGTGIILEANELVSSTTPHTVSFEADVIDPDGDALSYRWSFGDGIDFDGDGIGDTATSTEANPTYTYTKKGEYTVELVVTDENGAATVFDSQTVVVGQKPEVTITSPANGYLFRAGETLTFTGSAFDPEDGILSGESVVWSAVFLHNEHTHPGISGVANQVGGNDFYIQDFGHDYSSNTGYEIFLTATDSDGISTTESVIVRPDKVDITFDAPIDKNYSFLLDGLAYKGDYTHDTIINFQHTIEAQEKYIVNGIQHDFLHWEDDISNDNPLRSFTEPETNKTFRPIYSSGTVVKNALSLNGKGGITVPNLVVGQDRNDFTIEAWIKFDGDTSISNVDAILGTGTLNNGNDINFYDGKMRLYSSNGGDVIIANHQSQKDVWTHYALVRESGEIKIYVDGELDVTVASNWGETFVIDRIAAGVPRGGLNGEIDELKIWSVARTQAEINLGKNTIADSATLGLERYYQFDGGIIDATGFSNEVAIPDNAQIVESTAPVQLGINLAPVAVDDNATVTEGSTSHLHILDNDYDPDGSINPQAVEILIAPSHGTLGMIDTQAELDARGINMHHFGHAEYTPELGFTGTDSFSYRVQDDQGEWSNPATVNITVEPVVTNTAPVALDDNATTDEDTSVTINVLGNDSDVDGDIMLVLEASATNGSVVINSDRTLTYTPNPGYHGEDWISYRINDGNGGEDTAIVNLTINPDSTVSSDNNVLSLDGTGGIDIEDLTLSGDFTVETWVKLGDGSTLNLKDAIVGSGNLGNGNDINFAAGKARIYSSGYTGNDPVIAKQSARLNQWTHYAFVRENGVAQIYIDGQLNSTSSGQWNSDFVVSKIGQGVRNEGLNGELEELRIWSTARTQAEIEAGKNIEIAPSTSGLERYYRFNDDNFIDVSGNSSELITLPSYAQLVNSTSPVQDSGINLAPVAVDDIATVTEGSTSHLHILDNDHDPDGSINPQAVEILTAPSHGTLEMIDTQAELDARGINMHHFGHAEYTPETGFTGTDSFIYRVQDNEGAWSNPATMTITVEGETSNIAPMAADDNSATYENQSVTINVLANDHDADGDFLLVLEATASNGTVEINSDRTLTYTPNANYIGEDWITYRISDGNGGEDTATVNLSITPDSINPGQNRALALDGTNGIDVEDLSLTGDFTIEAWVKFSEGQVINNRDGIVSGNNNDINFYAGKARIYSPGGHGNDPVIATTSSLAGEWQHYAFTRESGVAKVYLNGVLNSTSTNVWNGKFDIDEIGSGVLSGGLDGELDELRIWSIARTEVEIANNLGIEIDASTPELERYYQFNDGIVDATGNSDEVSFPSHAELVDSTAPIEVADLNIAPVAIDNSVTVLEDSINFIRILDNDYDSDGTLNPLMVEILTEPAYGSVEILDTQAELDARNRSINYFGRAEYSTPEGFSGTDVFTYRVQDDEGAWSNPATVTITVGAQDPIHDHDNDHSHSHGTHSIDAIAFTPFDSETEEDAILMGSNM